MLESGFSISALFDGGEEATTGPDRVLAATEFTSSDPSVPVKLWMPADSEPVGLRKPISVPTLLNKTAQQSGDHMALSVTRGGTAVQWTYKEYLEDVNTVAKAFIKLGLAPGHGVGIIGFNTPEWLFADLGCVFAGGLATGIYPTNSAEACQYVLANCRANVVVVEDQKQLSKVLAIKPNLPNLKCIVQYSGEPNEKGVLSWSQLLEIGKKENRTELDRRLLNLAPNLCCHLVYTSGTTGPPKGVMLTHDNLVYTARTLVDHYGLQWEQERLVSYLPLSHVAANIMDIFMVTTCAGTLYFANKDALKGTLTTSLREAKPTIFFGVPRVWEKVREKMIQVGKSNTGFKKAVGMWAKKTGLDHNKGKLAGKRSANFSYKLAEKIVFSKVKEQLGFSHTHSFFSAAAPISSEVLDYFLSLDIKIWEIYGMSEISGPQTGNDKDTYKPGTIGKDLLGFNTKLDRTSAGVSEICSEGGELCMRGRNVFMGYLGNIEKTQEVFDSEGWHHSGDVGRMDEEGFLTVTGRIKEILITAGGENVPPFIIENMVKNELVCLSHVMLIGDRRKFLSCLVTLKVEVDQETLEPKSKLTRDTIEWCKSVDSKAETIDDILSGPDTKVMEAIQRGFDRYNLAATSNAQRVQKWTILPADFSIPGGEIGPTMKVKRHAVLKKYQENVEKLYET